jgi:hypothetical protein
MTLNQLASLIAKREGKRSQARIGDIREILKILVLIDAEDCIARPDGDDGPIHALVAAVEKELVRARKKKK